MDARITLVQVLAAYTNPESHNAQRHRRTDRQTDGQQAAANSRSYCVAVRSAKNSQLVLGNKFPTKCISGISLYFENWRNWWFCNLFMGQPVYYNKDA